MDISEAPDPIAPSSSRPRLFLTYDREADGDFASVFVKCLQSGFEITSGGVLDDRNPHLPVDLFCTVVLVGAQTWSSPAVIQDIVAALSAGRGLIGVQLPTGVVGDARGVNAPDALSDNIFSGYALWVTWANITQSASACRQLVGQASGRDRAKIILRANAHSTPQAKADPK